MFLEYLNKKKTIFKPLAHLFLIKNMENTLIENTFTKNVKRISKKIYG